MIEVVRVHRLLWFRWVTRAWEPIDDIPALARAAGGI